MIWKLLHRFFAAEVPVNPKRILVVREAAIGDVLCMTPFLKQLRQKYPAAQLDYVVVSWAKDILLHNPNIDHIYTASNDIIQNSTLKLAWKRLLFFRKLVPNQYDLIFIPTTQLKYKLPLILFRKAYKIGFSTEPKDSYTKYNFMLDDYVWIDLNEIPRTRHIAVRYLEMLDLISDAPVSREDKLEIVLTDAEQNAVDKVFEQLGIEGTDELIAIAAAAGSAIKSDSVIKTAPAEKFIEVTKQLLQNNPRRKIVYIGASSERQYVENMQICDGRLIFNLCGMLSLRESAELLRRCSLLISNDSGATHLASALGIKHMVWFGATDDVEFGPYRNPNAIVYRVDLPCAPCRENACTVPESNMTSHAKRPFCLTMIDAQQVTAIAEQMMNGDILSSHYFQSVCLNRSV